MRSAPQQKKTPIALFVYNRPAHANSALESMSHCDRLDECSLHIYCDGPKHAADEPAVNEARQVARQWVTRLGGEIFERDTNAGLSRSIVSGVSELCRKYNRVIVVEDDFVLSPSFVDYMLQALDRYADEPNVYQVSGYMFPVEHAAQPDAFFLPLTTTWGWATWARAWRIFDWDAGDAPDKLLDSNTRKRFDLDSSYPYANMLRQRLRNENDSWGILFWWAVFKRSGLALHPRESLVQVGGFDGSGTHIGDYLWSRSASGMMEPWDFKLPDKVEIDQAAFARTKGFLKKEQYPGSLAGRIWRRLERYAAASQRPPASGTR